ncbi:hypothetical protein DQ239_00910 [Blastococcus sp. TF02-09]|uniref:putative leader peptide n=1 Tax=Blastococcus sp. TF02-09 TaxID=2250576 RepID=UPI000DEBE5B5|nr:putative leader peptide [Blastococcus sp. TF02-9]RBY81210.1 hypothetical protein DQ239_00910 [Blastococcus sp. TF02-9]
MTTVAAARTPQPRTRAAAEPVDDGRRAAWSAPTAPTRVIANQLYRRPAVDLRRTASALCPAC